MYRIILIGLALISLGMSANAQDINRTFLTEIDDSTTVLKFGRYRIELRDATDTLDLTPRGMFFGLSVRAVIYEVDTLGLGNDSGVSRAVLIFTDSLGTSLWRNDTLSNGDLIIVMSRDAGVNWDTVYTGSSGAFADSAGEVTDQTIDGNDIDSTSENFVFDGAYHVTSATEDSAYITIQTLEDTAASRLLLSGGQMTGNITMSGVETVDGKDVSTLTDIGQTVEGNELGTGLLDSITTAYDSSQQIDNLRAEMDDSVTATNVNAAGAVMESDFNATTFLYATSDNTPQPKTPTEVRSILNVEDGATADQTVVDSALKVDTTTYTNVWVHESGDTMSGDLNMNDNDLLDVDSGDFDDLRVTGNFWGETCAVEVLALDHNRSVSLKTLPFSFKHRISNLWDFDFDDVESSRATDSVVFDSTECGTTCGVHPDVEATPNGWPVTYYDGDTLIYSRRLYMVQTPTHPPSCGENPTVYWSDDKENWYIPFKLDTLNDSIIYAPVPVCDGLGGATNTDPQIIVAGDGKMYLYWRWVDSQGADSTENIYVKSSANAVDWSDSTLLFSTNRVVATLSPAVLYDDDLYYRMWTIDKDSADNVIRVERSVTPDGFDYVKTTLCTLSNIPSGWYMWQFNIAKAGGLYVMVATMRNGSDYRNYLAKGYDGISWTFDDDVLTQGSGVTGAFDSVHVYTGDIVSRVIPSGYMFDYWYSGNRQGGVAYNIGYTTITMAKIDSNAVGSGQIVDGSIREIDLDATSATTGDLVVYSSVGSNFIWKTMGELTILTEDDVDVDTAHWNAAWVWGDHSAAIHDSCNAVRSEIRDTSAFVAHDTADVLRTELADDSVWGQITIGNDSTSDHYIYFENGATDEYFMWDSSAGRFEFSDELLTEHLFVSNWGGVGDSWRIGYWGASATPSLYFFNNGVSNAAWLQFDTVANQFALSNDLDVTGNIIVSGTVDGVDVLELHSDYATDSAKLDGIEAGATADQTVVDSAIIAADAWAAHKDKDGDTIDVSAYEVQLNDEAGLYGVLSDVSDFVQPAEVPGLETDATALAAVGDTINARMTKAVTGNTETRIAVTYNSTDSTYDFVVDDMNDDVPEAGDYTALTGGHGITHDPTGTIKVDTANAVADAETKPVTGNAVYDFCETTKNYALNSELHTRSHTMTSTSDHTAGNYKLFHSNGSGEVMELAHGTSSKVLTSGGASSVPTWETPTGAFNWQDSAGEPPYWVDSAKYAATSGGFTNAFIPGKLTVTGPIIQYNHENVLDTTHIFCRHSDSFYTFTSPDSQLMHPSIVYIEGGKWGFEYWLALTPPQANNENPHIFVSHDAVTWQVFVSGTDTLKNPVITCDSFGTCQYLSDPDLVWAENGDLYLIFRVTRLFGTEYINYVYCIHTSNGIDWGDTVMMLDGFYNAGTPVSPDTATVGHLSPAINLDSAGQYTMYTVVDTSNQYYTWAIWKAPRIDTAWTRAEVDSTFLFGPTVNSDDTIWIGIAQWNLPGSERHYHGDFLRYSGGQIVGLIAAKNSRKLYMGISRDGEYFNTVGSGPLLEHIDSNWAEKTIYRPTGFFTSTDDRVAIKMFYCGSDSSDVWRTSKPTLIQFNPYAYQWLELSEVYGFNRALSDSIYLYDNHFDWDSDSGSIVYRIYDSAGNIDAGDRDTFMLACQIPYACTIDSVWMLYFATGDSGIVDVKFVGPKIDGGRHVLLDSTYWSNTTNHAGGTFWTPDTAQYPFSNYIDALPKQKYGIIVITDFRADNNVTGLTAMMRIRR